MEKYPDNTYTIGSISFGKTFYSVGREGDVSPNYVSRQKIWYISEKSVKPENMGQAAPSPLHANNIHSLPEPSTVQTIATNQLRRNRSAKIQEVL